jgi:DNA-directed RNA polymerase subunit RPC12/RpoP
MPTRGLAPTTVDLSSPVYGLSVATKATGQDVRCPNCDKKLGERLVGTLEVTCPRCKRKVTITR